MNYFLKRWFLVSFSVSFFMCSCSGVNFSEWRFPYMYPVQQGNYVTEQQVSLLKVGMAKDQVAAQIGSPVTSFIFESDSWQYVYQEYKNNKLANSYIVNVNFDKNDRLSSVESAGEVFLK